jgi:hypothetical protein
MNLLRQKIWIDGKTVCFSFFYLCAFLGCNEKPKSKIEHTSLQEFELLNLCHCHEYLTLRHYDYVKWRSEKDKKKRIDEEKYLVFGQYMSGRQHSLYYQKKYDSSLFYSKGLSLLIEDTRLHFKRLDSLYYEPLVQHYVQEEAETNTIPYLGIRHNNFFWDCFHKVKEIPLKEELDYFVQANRGN